MYTHTHTHLLRKKNWGLTNLCPDYAPPLTECQKITQYYGSAATSLAYDCDPILASQHTAQTDPSICFFTSIPSSCEFRTPKNNFDFVPIPEPYTEQF